MCECEKTLLMKVAAGNENAFRQLFNQYHHHLGRCIFRITNSQEQAEEIVQDIFLKIWLNRETLVDIQNFKAYLFVLSKNYTINYLRKLAKELLLQNKWKAHFINSSKTDTAFENIYYHLLDEAIDRLPPQQQKVYILSRHQRLKYAEIALKLNISTETVKDYLKRANVSITAYLTSRLEINATLIFALIFFA